MTQRQDKDAFESWMRQQLDAGKAEIDGATRTRLQAMRREAVARAAETGTASNTWTDVLAVPAWQWGGALTAVLILGLLVVQLSRDPAHEMLGGIEDAALLSAAEEMEFFQELEFYGWLHETEQAG